MKTILTKATGSFADHGAVGFVHLNGVFDTTACGLDYGDYKTNPPIMRLTVLHVCNIWTGQNQWQRKLKVNPHKSKRHL